MVSKFFSLFRNAYHRKFLYAFFTASKKRFIIFDAYFFSKRFLNKKFFDIKFWILISILSSPIYAQAPYGEGFLGLTFTPMLETSSNFDEMRFGLPLTLEAASQEWTIFSRLTFFSDVLHLSNQINKDPSFLEKNNWYTFSFFMLQVDYETLSWKNVVITSGFGLGHRGLLSEQISDLQFSFYASLRLGSLWFISRKFMASLHWELPLSLYSHNIKNLFFSFGNFQITYDPIGPIRNPLPDTALYSIGFEYEGFRFKHSNQLYSAHIYRPYIKISILY